MALRAAPRPAGATSMALTRLTLVDFRSYAAAELTPDPGLTIVAAPNGTGKTNLLEAIHVAITGRSHRAAVDADLVRHGRPFARARLDLADGTAAGGSTIELGADDGEADGVSITAHAADVGDNADSVEAAIEGSPTAIAFNARYLIDVLSNLGAEEAALELSGPLAPGVILGIGKDDYVHVIMPVRTAS